MPIQTGDAKHDPIAAVAAQLGLENPDVTPLCGGLSNRTLRMKDSNHDVVLRLAGAGAEALGVDRRAELAMLEVAATAGLAPPVVLARPAEGLLVTRHVGGRVLSREDARESAMLVRIGGWLSTLHALAPPAIAGIDIAARAAGYLQALRARESTELLPELERRLAASRASLPPLDRLAACHHDLHHRNLVDTGGGLVAFDWEYAGPGDPAADLAACICYHDLDRRQTSVLLGGYGGDSGRISARLDPLCWIFDCLCFGWMEIAAGQGLAADPERRRILIDRLTA